MVECAIHHIITCISLIACLALTLQYTKILEFGLVRSLRGLCENKKFLSCTPARCKILLRNGPSSLAKNITARPCETLFLPNLRGPKGGAATLKKGGRASLLGSRHFVQDQSCFSTMYWQYVPMSILSCISCKTRVARQDPGLARKVMYVFVLQGLAARPNYEIQIKPTSWLCNNILK